MEPRVRFENGIISLSWDWEQFITKPAQEGNYQEAFASADAIIDNFSEAILRKLYHEYKSQDLIGQLHKLRGRANFDGMIILSILKNKGVFNEAFYQRVAEFKKDRNLVLHSVESHCNLINPKVLLAIKTQIDFDRAATDAANLSLKKAHEILMDFYKKMHEINGKEEDFFKIHLVKGGKIIKPNQGQK